MRYSEEYWSDIDEIISYIVNVKELCDKRILLTGATGMLLSPVVDILFWLNVKYGTNNTIIIASRNRKMVDERFPYLKEGKNYNWIHYDMLHNEEIHCDVDFIIHAAGNSSPLLYRTKPIETITGCVNGINTMLKLLCSNVNARLLFISSSEVYGKIADIPMYKEEDTGIVDSMAFRACYPNAKRIAETLCMSYRQEHKCDVVIARPGHIYGPTIVENDDRASAQFIKSAMKGEDICLKSSGLSKRSYCYVLDCASALMTILINGQEGNAYNIANPETNVSIRNIAECIATTAGCKLLFETPSDKELSGFNLMDNSVLSSEKLESLGWRAAYNLDTGVKKTMNYYR